MTGPRGEMTLIAAARRILAQSKEPLTSSEIMRKITSAGLWKSSGKTPQNTLYAALTRDIKLRGTKSEFKKVKKRFAISK